jgi:putative nucleotidyltransferase with HDIG domain
MYARAKTYIGLVLLLGAASALVSALRWETSEPIWFVTLFVLSIVTSLLRVTLPSIQGSLSLNYVFLIWGVARLGLGETILMGIVSAVVQTYWRCEKKPQPIQVTFNLALIALSVTASKLVFVFSRLHAIAPGEVIPLILASLVYYALNTGAVTGVIALTEGRGFWHVWRSFYLWTLPHFVLAPTIVVAGEALMRVLGMEVVALGLPAAYLVQHTLRVHITGLKQAVERVELEKRHAEQTASLHLRTIRALALAIEAKDRTTGEHLHRVQTYALGLASEFGLGAEDTEALRAAAILHDIGKIAVPEYIISKPGRLTPEEFQKMKVHTVVGAEIIESVRFPFPVAPLIAAHHEKWDGTGYPRGLNGEQIPLGARILSAVDCFDALACDRQYRKALPLDEAIEVLRRESGKAFDPAVVEALSRRYRELEGRARETLEGTSLELSLNVHIECGTAPDAGFAQASAGNRNKSARARSPQEVDELAEVHTQMSRHATLQEALAATAKSLRRLLPFDCLALYNVRNAVLTCSLAEGEGSQHLRNIAIPVGTGVSGWVAETGRPLLNGNALTEFGVNRAVPSGFPLKAGLAVPLEFDSGAAAVLTLYRCEKDAFASEDLRVLLAIASWLAFCTSPHDPGFGEQLACMASRVAESVEPRNLAQYEHAP